MREIDMTPYEKHFTELERLYFEKKARMNVAIYMSNDGSFSKDIYNKVFNDYVVSLKDYDNFIPIFEREVIVPVCGGPTAWRADFEQRVIYID